VRPVRRHLSQSSFRQRSVQRARRGFTLVQVLVALGIIGILAGALMPVISRSRAASARTRCDVRLKAIALALDANRQETGAYPVKLADLATNKYLSTNDLKCPNDPRANGSYEEYYVWRGPREDRELPAVICPFHESDGNHGAQAYTGRHTQQFSVKETVLADARNVTVETPGKAPFDGATGMILHGGDRIRTGAGGAATIRFADGSTAALQGDTSVTVLQSFLERQSKGVVYSLVRQTIGVVNYQVTHGSKFDVATPTATAGVRGTTFTITVAANGDTSVIVTTGTVLLSNLHRTVTAPVGILSNILQGVPGSSPLPDLGLGLPLP